MARSATKSATASSAPVAVVAPVAAAAPVVAEKPQKKQKKEAAAAAAPVEVAPVVAPVEVAAPVTEVASEELPAGECLCEVADRLVASIKSRISDMQSGLNELKTELKLLEKVRAKELKAASKGKKKARKTNPNSQASGFMKPTRISDELSTFLGVQVGSEMARTQVTKLIHAYIKEQKLQDPENKRSIVPDARLGALLKLRAGEPLTYFNLQTFLGPHFEKKEKKPVATA